MKWSILICTIDARHDMFYKLAGFLQNQIKDRNQVELRYLCDSGGISIGVKRQILLEQATGEYINYVDDDDLVSEHYVKLILEALKPRPDCVGIEGILRRQSMPDAQFLHSLQYKCWYQNNGIYYRTPNHLNPIKRKLASKVGFIDKNHGEDRDYSDRIYKLLRTEVMIKYPIYFYYPGTTQNAFSI